MSNEKKPTVLYPNACNSCRNCPIVAEYLRANATTPPVETERWDGVGTVIELTCSLSPEYLLGKLSWREDRTMDGKIIYTQYVSHWVREPLGSAGEEQLVRRETGNKIKENFPSRPSVTCPFSDE